MPEVLKNIANEKDFDIFKGGTKPEKNIFLFFSFDLVDSTKFKTANKTKSIWPYVISKFYDLIIHELRETVPQVVVWKYLGDEILLYTSIKDINHLYSLPQSVYDLQLKVSQDLLQIFNIYIDKRIEIKSTIWLAATEAIQSDAFDASKLCNLDSFYRNIQILTNVGPSVLTDFIGPDIDIGFRISKNAFHHKVTISANFAYLLLRMKKPKKEKSIDSKLRIVSYEELKGIWDGRFYPIIWFFPEWNEIKKSFSYDDYKENKIIENILFEQYFPISEIEDVYSQLNKTDYADQIVDNVTNLFVNKNEENIIL